MVHQLIIDHFINFQLPRVRSDTNPIEKTRSIIIRIYEQIPKLINVVRVRIQRVVLRVEQLIQQ